MVATLEAPAKTAVEPARIEPYRVSVTEYQTFRRQGYLVVPALVSTDEVDELRRHTEDLMQGRLPEQQGREMEDVIDLGTHVVVEKEMTPRLCRMPKGSGPF